jgi:anti-anti-sigma regulatory factor
MMERFNKLPVAGGVTRKLTVPEFDLQRVELLLPELLKWVVVVVILLTSFSSVSSSYGGRLVVLGLPLLATAWALRRWSRRGFVSEAVNLLLAAVTFYITLAVPPDFLVSGYVLVVYALPVVAAALLLTPGAAQIWAVIAMLAMVVRAVVVAGGPDVTFNLARVAVSVVLFSLLTWLIGFLSRSLQQSRVSLRRQIDLGRTGVEIGHMVTSALDTSAIIRQAVEMIQKAFDYYHVGLYTLDTDYGVAVLADAAGGTAADLMERGFRVPLNGVTVVAFAINQKCRQALFSWDEIRDSNGRNVEFTHKRSATRAELVIPLQIGDQTYGALDIHSLELDAFSEGDIHILEGISGNIANALEGAMLFEERRRAAEELEKAYAEVGKRVEERTAELQRETAERERLQQEVIEAQQRAIRDLTTPIIPVMDRIIIVPLIGSIDDIRARDMTRMLLEGIRENRAKIVILDITGVSLVDSAVADYLNKTIQAARLKGAQTVVTGISDAVAETIVDLGIDWTGVETVGDLQKGLRTALAKMGLRIEG